MRLLVSYKSVLFASAAAGYLATLIAAETLPSAALARWLLLTTVASYASGFGALSLNQVWLRRITPGGAPDSSVFLTSQRLVLSMLGGTVFSLLVWPLLVAGSSRSVAVGFLQSVTVGLSFSSTLYLSTECQAAGRFLMSSIVSQLWRFMLLLAIVVVWATTSPERRVYSDAVFLFVVALSAVVVWVLSSPRLRLRSLIEPLPQVVREASTITSAQVAVAVMTSADRWIVATNSASELAAGYLFNATMAGGAFAVLQSVTGYSLVARLRSCDFSQIVGVVTEQRRTVRLVVLLSAAALIVGYALVAPAVSSGLYLDWSVFLVLAAAGALRPLSTVASALITAFATGRELALANAISWIGASALIVLFLSARGALTPDHVAFAVLGVSVFRFVLWNMLSLRILSRMSL